MALIQETLVRVGKTETERDVKCDKGPQARFKTETVADM